MPFTMADMRSLARDIHFRVFVLTTLAAVLAMLGVSDKMQHCAEVIAGGMFAGFCVWSGGRSYVAGKTVEGAVPPGMQPGQKFVIQLGGREMGTPDVLHEAADLLKPLAPQLSGMVKTAAERLTTLTENTDPADLAEAFREGFDLMEEAMQKSKQSPDGDQSAPQPASGSVKNVAAAALILVLTVAGFAALSGCTASLPFREYAAAEGPQVASELTDYANADASLATADRAQVLSDAQAIAVATTDMSKIKESAVKAAWLRVEPRYLAYVAADPLLDADAKSLRVSNVQRLDRLIAKEESRSPLFGGAGVTSTQPTGSS